MAQVTAATMSTCHGVGTVSNNQQSNCLCTAYNADTWNSNPDPSSCCGQDGMCSCCGIQPGVCPTLSLSTGQTAPIGGPHLVNGSACTGAETCPVACRYPITAFNTADDVQAYIDAFGMDSGWINQLMPAWCQQQVTTCITDPTTGQPMPQCSRMSSRAADGDLCQQWLTVAPTTVTDPVKTAYCRAYNTPDCLCVNRLDNPIYRALAAGYTFNAGCWWIPCESAQTYLVPSDVDVNVHDPGVCPSTVCDAIINNFQSSNISLNDVKQYVSCANLPSGGGCSPPCPAGQTCVNGVCQPSGGCSPPCQAGQTCVNGVCQTSAPSDGGRAILPIVGGALAIVAIAALAYLLVRAVTA